MISIEINDDKIQNTNTMCIRRSEWSVLVISCKQLETTSSVLTLRRQKCIILEQYIDKYRTGMGPINLFGNAEK